MLLLIWRALILDSHRRKTPKMLNVHGSRVLTVKVSWDIWDKLQEEQVGFKEKKKRISHCVPLFCSYNILMLSVIYYRTGVWQGKERVDLRSLINGVTQTSIQELFEFFLISLIHICHLRKEKTAEASLMIISQCLVGSLLATKGEMSFLR